MDLYIRAITLISKLCGIVAALLIAAAVVVVCHMVFVRSVLNQNTIWQTDFTTYSLIAATFIGAPFLLLNRGHVNVDVLPLYLGPTARFWLALAAGLMSFAFCATMTVLGFHGGSHCRPGYGDGLRAAEAAAIFDDMRQLPGLIERIGAVAGVS